MVRGGKGWYECGEGSGGAGVRGAEGASFHVSLSNFITSLLSPPGSCSETSARFSNEKSWKPVLGRLMTLALLLARPGFAPTLALLRPCSGLVGSASLSASLTTPLAFFATSCCSACEAREARCP